MELPSYFTDFLANIRPTDTQRAKMKKEHRKLRDLLLADEELGPLMVSTFIQGSYRRYTATRPQDSQQCDVDVIAVTKIHENDYTPRQALEKFRPFLKKHYPGKYQLQGRSWAIDVDDEVTLDLVPTSAPSESEQKALEWSRAASWDFPDEPATPTNNAYENLLLEGSGYYFEKFSRAAADLAWKQEPLRIPDREADFWDDTHPLEQIRWTWDKSKSTNAHYVNVVKAGKWWRKLKVLRPKYPKSYPLEHMIGDCCADGINSVATGVTLALETMEATYRPYVDMGSVPHLADRGVPQHNVLARVEFEDFAAFLDEVKSAAQTAREALDADTVKESADLWRELFGNEFPAAPEEEDAAAGYTPRTKKTQISGGRFA